MWRRSSRLLLLSAAGTAAAALLISHLGCCLAAAKEGAPQGPSSLFAGAPTEEEALQQLNQVHHQRQQYQQQQGEQQQQQQKDEEQLQQDVQFALRRGWWRLAQGLILHSHEIGSDVASVVRRVAMEIRNHLTEVERLLSKQHDAIAVMSPAFQWAESPLDIFLNIKFAYRWSSPGALSLEDSSFSSDVRSFAFSGLAQHSGVKRKYLLQLPLYKDIIPEKTKWSFASVGKAVVSLRKKELGIWGRLTADTAKIANMNVWLDMREKVQKDVEAFKAGNYTIPTDEETPESPQQQEKTEKGDEL